ncbi:MAG TPA: cupin domain-containing protein, partial [Blastocatellia bacterium]|nr:cupin domain-containing protein [Blastocatellia bacterium]
MSNQTTTPVATPSVGSTEPVQIINLTEVDPVQYDWGAIKWICDMNTTPNSQQSFGYASMLPGTTNPEHRHMRCQEVIYVLAGELTVFAHGERTVVRPGQTVLIPQGV